MITKTLKVEVRIWDSLKKCKIRKPNGDRETFSEVLERLIKEKK